MSQIDDQETATFDELGLVNFPTQEGLLADLSVKMTAKQGFSIATLNLDHIVKMRSNATFKSAYVAHTHVVADGNPIVWASGFGGRQIELVPGSELIKPLAKLAASLDVPIAMLGARQDTLDAAAERLEAEFPGLRVVAKIAPPYGYDPTGEDAKRDLEAVAASGAGLCFLALGAPKQEVLAIQAATHAPQCGFVSIGAGLDFIAGHQKRAPEWVQKIAMEWLWRMLSNPRRLAQRYLQCLLILPGLMMRARQQRKAVSGL